MQVQPAPPPNGPPPPHSSFQTKSHAQELAAYTCVTLVVVVFMQTIFLILCVIVIVWDGGVKDVSTQIHSHSCGGWGGTKAAAFSSQLPQRLLETNNVNKVLCSPGRALLGIITIVALSQVKTGSLRHLLCSWIGLYLRFCLVLFFCSCPRLRNNTVS